MRPDTCAELGHMRVRMLRVRVRQRVRVRVRVRLRVRGHGCVPQALICGRLRACVSLRMDAYIA